MPLRFAERAIAGSAVSRLVALEYQVWMWRSGVMRMASSKVRYTLRVFVSSVFGGLRLGVVNLYADDIVATVDVVYLAGYSRGEVAREVDGGLRHVPLRYVSAERRLAPHDME